MDSFDKIRNDFLAYANSLEMEGVAVEKLCSLLAYSAYRNQVLQSVDNLEISFSTATKLNSRIHHAANFQYSVPRGKCPVLKVNNILALESKTYYHLDFIMSFNGYHFYLDLSDNIEYKKTTVASTLVDGGLNLLCSSYIMQTTSPVNTTDNVYFIDFIESTNVSEDFILYVYDPSGVQSLVPSDRVTNNSSKFYYKTQYTNPESGEVYYDYEFDYLTVTIPDYGVRVIRHADRPWEGSTMVMSYIPYNETTPNFEDLTSIPGFSLIGEPANSQVTTVETIPFEPRLENLDSIYSNAISSYLQQGSVATPDDLMIELLRYEPNAYYKVYIDTKITVSGDNYDVQSDGAYATVVYLPVATSKTAEDVERECIDNFVKSLSVSNNIVVVRAKAKNTDDESQQVRVEVKAFSASKSLSKVDLDNVINSYMSRIGQPLNHSQFEADIIKLGFDYVKVYNRGTNVETTFNITCQEYEYPSLEAEVKQ